MKAPTRMIRPEPIFSPLAQGGYGMQRFTDLIVWQRSHQLVLTIYRLTACFPAEELYGVTSQLRRAAVSVPSNIAEGSKRKHAQDYARFLNLAESSLVEAEYFVMLSRDLEFFDQSVKADELLREIEEISRMLSVLRKKVENKNM
jgi:four helix bundle protein